MTAQVNRPPLDKTATTQHPVEALLRQRWSPLAFSSRPVEPEKLRSALEAASWAASSFNEQPWRYLVTTQEAPADFQRLLGCLAEGNQVWAKDAPVLMLSVASLRFARTGAENRHAFHDVGAASANLCTQATALGLFVHQMAGFDVNKAQAEFGIAEGYEPVAVIALGYRGDPQALSEQLQQREFAPRSRRPLTDFVFSGQWQQTAPLGNS